MFDKLIIGRYIQGDSLIHNLDPRTKLLLSFYFIILVFMGTTYISNAVMILFVLAVVYLTGIRMSYFLRGIRPMIWLILFTVIFQILFSTGGTVYFAWGPFAVTSEGLVNGLFIFIRLVLIIMMSTVLTLTTSPLELTDGIEHLLRPLTRFGVPAHEIALMMSIALRYVPTLMDEAQKIMNAQRSRGVEFDEGSFMDRVKAFVPILVPLFISAFNRADEMANAMEARGYHGGEGRTKYRQLAYHRIDVWALIAMVCLTLCVIVSGYYGI